MTIVLDPHLIEDAGKKFGITDVPDHIDISLIDLIHRVTSRRVRQTLGSDAFPVAGEWADAGCASFDRGYVLFKNDDEWLYVIVDVVGDLQEDSRDYFKLAIDTTQKPEPHQPAHSSHLVIQPLVDPLTGNGQLTKTTGALTPHDSSQVLRQSRVWRRFGNSQILSTPHRFWRMKLLLAEVGMKALAKPFTKATPEISFGIAVGSDSPAFDVSSDSYTLVLAPPVPHNEHYGSIISEIGTTSVRSIDPLTGLVNGAPFGGTLDFLIDTRTRDAMIGAAITEFTVQHEWAPDLASLNSAAVIKPFEIEWDNPAGGVSTKFCSNNRGAYPLPDLHADYQTKGLLFRWATQAEPDGLHRIHIVASGNARYEDQLTICINNSRVSAIIEDVVLVRADGSYQEDNDGLFESTSPDDHVRVSFRVGPLSMLHSYATHVYRDKSQWALEPAECRDFTEIDQKTGGGKFHFTLPPSAQPYAAYCIVVTAYSKVTSGYDRNVIRDDAWSNIVVHRN